MKQQRSRKFRLVPALDPREATLSAAAFFPALPVEIGGLPPQVEYATLDVSLQISRISPDLLAQTGIPSPVGRHPADPVGLVLVHMPLAIRDQDFRPWLHFRKVPFSVSPELGSGTNPSRIVLGSRGVLEFLRITFDFPKKTMTMAAPARFHVDSPSSRTPDIPSSLAQAEDLIEAGSYSSAVLLATTGLEQAILPATYHLYSSSGVGAVAEVLQHAGNDPQLSDEVIRMYEVRALAVHGGQGREITEADARKVLSTTKSLIRRASKSA